VCSGRVWLAACLARGWERLPNGPPLPQRSVWDSTTSSGQVQQVCTQHGQKSEAQLKSAVRRRAQCSAASTEAPLCGRASLCCGLSSSVVPPPLGGAPCMCVWTGEGNWWVWPDWQWSEGYMPAAHQGKAELRLLLRPDTHQRVSLQDKRAILCLPRCGREPAAEECMCVLGWVEGGEKGENTRAGGHPPVTDAVQTSGRASYGRPGPLPGKQSVPRCQHCSGRRLRACMRGTAGWGLKSALAFGRAGGAPGRAPGEVVFPGLLLIRPIFRRGAQGQGRTMRIKANFVYGRFCNGTNYLLGTHRNRFCYITNEWDIVCIRCQ